MDTKSSLIGRTGKYLRAKEVKPAGFFSHAQYEYVETTVKIVGVDPRDWDATLFVELPSGELRWIPFHKITLDP